MRRAGVGAAAALLCAAAAAAQSDTCLAEGSCPADLGELERLKAAAVEGEDFLEAARLKKAIKELKAQQNSAEAQIKKLQAQKAAAVEAEDFVEAARLKKEIDNLKKGGGGKPAAKDPAPKKPADSGVKKEGKKLFGVDLGKAKDKASGGGGGAPSGAGYISNRTSDACSGSPNYEGHRPGCVHYHTDEYTGQHDCGMVYLSGGPFKMGSEFSGEATKDKDLKSRYGDNTIHGINVADAEHPVREETVAAFYMDRCEVTNAQFKEFVDARKYQTDAEVYQWSFVMEPWVSKELLATDPSRVEAAPWWLAIEGADWLHPEGPKSSLEKRASWFGDKVEKVPKAPAGDRWGDPVNHVSWRDAYNFCRWRGKRLPTEAEWEFGVRGGLEQKIFPWGDELYPGFAHRHNVWQGDFQKQQNTAEDGWQHIAPVASYLPNGHGLYDMTGNVWEWVDDDFTRGEKQQVADRKEAHGSESTCARVVQKTKRGGSYMCHASTCNRYRTSGRTGIESDSSTANLGFRCARAA